jgi:MFS family permease
LSFLYFCLCSYQSYNDLNGKLGWGIFLIGVSCFITNGLAVKFGKRPVFIGGNLVLFMSSIWASQMNSFNGLFASRLFGCIGMSPFEVLVTATITDM